MLKSALELADLGWKVHPVHGIKDGLCTCARGVHCSSAGKHPVLASWTKAASNNHKVIRSWDWTDKNLGVVPGEDFCILDFDDLEIFQYLKASLPPLPSNTPMARTGRGGLHIYIAGCADSAIGVLPHLDIRGKGGQAVAPPSVHYSGSPYKWIIDPCKPPEAPEWLAVAQKDIPQDLQIPEVITSHDLSQIKGRFAKPLKKVLCHQPFAEKGDRHKTLASLMGCVAHRWPGCSVESVADLFQPSLDAMLTVDSGAPTREQLVHMLQKFCASKRDEQEKKPTILVSCDIEDMSQQAVKNLSRLNNLFTRANSLVTISSPERLPTGVLRGESPSSFVELKTATLKAQLSHIASWQKITKDGIPVSQYPPNDVVSYLIERGHWEGIPHVEGISDGSILRPDGTIFGGGGYDESTGVYCTGHTDKTPLPSVTEALELLEYLVQDFPFDGVAHKSAWYSALLTGVGLSCFRGPSPLFLIDANVKGSGKTLLAEITGLIATGYPPRRINIGGVDEIEDEKRITSAAISGFRSLLIDNVSGAFGNSVLCEALTLHSSIWTGRVLGKSKLWAGPFSPLWLATANNARISGDLGRRVCYVRLKSPLEDPSLRDDFEQRSLLSWVLENRSRLYRSALSLLYHYMQSGKKAELSPWGSYEGWTDLVRQAVVWTGLSDPGETRRELIDTSKDLVDSIFEGLEAMGLQKFRPSDIVRIVFQQRSEKHSDFREVLEQECHQKGPIPTTQSITVLLNRYRDRVYNGRMLVKSPQARGFWRIVSV